MKAVIGLVGEKGGGKETFMKFLGEELGGKYIIEQHRFSDVLFETLKLWRLPTTRENLQAIPVVMREGFGYPGILANVVEKRALVSSADIVILDGLRWLDADPPVLRRLPNNFLVYITAPVEVRYERSRKRGEKAGEKEATLEEFMRQEQARAEIEIPAVGKLADFKIDNSGTIEDFRKQVRKFVQKRLLLVLG